ncbi:MAG: hypothetical protein ABSH56_23215 [Bryobacteraceae bacterium]
MLSARDLNLIEAQVHEDLSQQATELKRMLAGPIQKLGGRG